MIDLRELIGINEQTWMEHPGRNCAQRPDALNDEIQIHADAWFPSEDGPTETKPTGRARRLCDGCPVASACLAYALTDPELRGIWGGTTTADRAKLRGDLGDKCGTYAGYLVHRKLDETACVRCSMANATASKMKRANAKKSAA
jgi:WhiB family redox-sensing transcriptional regulator